MSFLIDQTTSTGILSFQYSQCSRTAVYTSDGFNVLFYNNTSQNLFYAVLDKSGKGIKDPIQVYSDGSSSKIAVSIDSENNIHIIRRTTPSTNIYNLEYAKMTYSGDGIWSSASFSEFYSDGYAYMFDAIIDSDDRIWVSIFENDFVTDTYGDLKVTYSDNGSSWSSLETIKVSGNDFWKGSVPTLGLRDGKPVLAYANGTSLDFGLREWNGSSWGSEVSSSYVGAGYLRSISVVGIGSTAYIVYCLSYASGNNTFIGEVWITTWNGSSIGTPDNIVARDVGWTSAGTNGEKIFISLIDVLVNRRNRLNYKLIEYDPSTQKKSNTQIIVESTSSNYVNFSDPMMTYKFSGYPVCYWADNDGVNTNIYSRYFSKDYGIKIAKEGYDVKEQLTELNKKNFIVLNSVDSHKIYKAGFTNTGSFNHGAGKIPYYVAFEVDSITSPTYFKQVSASVTDSQIQDLPSNAYIIVFNEEG